MDAPDTTADPADDDRWLDDLGKKAGRSIRKQPPPGGLAAIERRRQARTMKLAAAGGSVAVLLTAGIFFLGRNKNDDESQAAVDQPTTIAAPTTAPATAAPTTIQPTTSIATTTTLNELTPRTGVTRVPATDLPPIQPVDASGATEFDVPPNPRHMATDGATLWIMHGDGQISRRDATSGADLGAVTGIPTSGNPEVPAVGFGALWVTTASNDKLWRVDAATGTVAATIDIPGDVPSTAGSSPHYLPGDNPQAANVTASGTSIWVLTRGQQPEFVEISPDTNSVVRRIPAPENAFLVQYGFGSLWSVSVNAGTAPFEDPIVRVDPSDGREIARIPSRGSIALAADDASLWSVELVEGTEALTRIDTTINAASIELAYPTFGGLLDIAFTPGHLWTNTGDAGLVNVDVETDRFVARYLDSTSGGGVVATPGSVWFVNAQPAKLYRIPIV